MTNFHRIKRPPRWLFSRLVIYLSLAIFPLVAHLFQMQHRRSQETFVYTREETETERGKSVNNKVSLLRFDWTNLDLQSELAKRFAMQQSNCTLSPATFRYRNRYGLGSDLHVYSAALCNALHSGYRVHTMESWIWQDQQACNRTTTTSPMLCYFPESEKFCPNDTTRWDPTKLVSLTRGAGRISRDCPSVEYEIPDIRAAAMEFLFSRVSSLVQNEAERQVRLVFAGGRPPKNLITVQIRWGDKKEEMKLVLIQSYVNAVTHLAKLRTLQSKSNENDDDDDDQVHVFLSTEDPKAVQAFREASPRHWTIYVDQYYTEMVAYRNDQYNGNPLVARNMQGRPGLWALGSLLVAMEANDFVLTTASNWSRLMNELRKNVLDPRCGNCTRMIDLAAGEW
jgi:hypothetical protein